MTEQTATKVHCDPTKKHDFVLIFDVTDGNPNGDPDAGNLPRTDPETMQGLVTDVALKRKVRNFVALVADDYEERRSALNIYVEHKGAALNAQHRKSYEALGIATSEPGRKEVTDEALIEYFARVQPEGFTLVEPSEEGGSYELVYSGELSKEDLTATLDAIGEENAEAKKFAKQVAAAATERKPSREQIENARDWMCRHFYDIRMFGAVMTTGVNAGQVRGPLQLTFARSVDPIIPQDLAITRVAITREEEQEKKETEMGRKTLIPYGLYVGHGFFSPHLAKQTGVTAADLELFWDALVYMWDLDRSASRGMMNPRGLYVFTHENKLGNAPSHQLFECISIRRSGNGASPRRFEDYEVRVDEDLPGGVTLTRVLG
ncbi:MAG: type I-C CRISPR-associated protein Cas7/Csd2 [Actinomycetota bacterium]